MHVLSTSSIAKGYEGHSLFDDVSFGLTSNDHVAIVGSNGSGKSTLLRVLAGEIAPDAGEVIYNSRAKVNYLPQDPQLEPGTSALAIVLDQPDVMVEQHEAEATLARLGIEDPSTLVGTMSGGQRRRVALARTLVSEADLTILDEPTNHLDADTVAWLEEALRRRPGGLLLVTHDRYVLERLCDRMIEIDQGKLFTHEGHYADLLEARIARQRTTDSVEARRRNLATKELAWLRRGPKARTSKPAFRVQQAEALLATAPPPELRQLELGTGRTRLGQKVIETTDLGHRYDERMILRDVTLRIGPGERIGIVGPNGAGKTTMLRLLAKQLDPSHGRVVHGPTVQLAVYEQEHRVAPLERRVLDTITDIAEWVPLANGERISAGALAERFGFSGRLQQASVSLLSGGERRRLALLHVLVDAPNVLVLDEPTNDLDLDTLASLEDHLDGFTGTLLVASHDRFLLDRLTDAVIAVEADGSIGRYQDWDGYREAHEARARTGGDAPAESTGDRSVAIAEDRERRRQLRAVEGRITRLKQQSEKLHTKLAEVAADYAAAAKVDAELRAVTEDLAECEDRWLELSVE